MRTGFKQSVALVASVVLAGAVTLGGMASAAAEDEALAPPDNVRVADLQANSFTVAWDAADGADDYVVRLYATNRWWLATETVRTADLTHTFFARQGATYEATVASYGHDGGFSDESERIEFTTPVDPDNPAVTTPSILGAESVLTDAGVDVQVNWSASHSDAGDVRYTLRVDTWPYESIGTTETNATFDARPDRTYRLIVRAEDGARRTSDWSEPFIFTSADVPVPSPPDNVHVVTEPGIATVTWDPADSELPIRDYEVVLNGTAKRSTITTGTSATFDYAPGGDFEVTVRSRDVESRWSEPSGPVGVTVPPHEDWSVPTAPTNLRVTFDNTGRAGLVEWDAASGGVGPLTYHLNIVRLGGWLMMFERTEELFVDLDGYFGKCGPRGVVTTFNVTASSFGVQSPPSETIELCF